MAHLGMVHPLVGNASWLSLLPMESGSTGLHYNNSSKLQHTQMNYVPPLPYHIILILEVGGSSGYGDEGRCRAQPIIP